MAVEFGTCPCGGRYETRFVEVRMTARNPPVVLTGIVQGACPQCGSRVYKRDVLERIESLMRGEDVALSLGTDP